MTRCHIRLKFVYGSIELLNLRIVQWCCSKVPFNQLITFDLQVVPLISEPPDRNSATPGSLAALVIALDAWLVCNSEMCLR